MADKPQSGRPKRISLVPKIIIRKSLSKRWQSTRKLACIVSKNSQRVSKDIVHRYLRNTMGAKPYKRPYIRNCRKNWRNRGYNSVLDKNFWMNMIGKGFFLVMKVLLNLSIQQIGRTTGFGIRIRSKLYLFKQLNSRLKSWSGGRWVDLGSRNSISNNQ